MAEFHVALARTLEFEGGYADDPADKGGETYRGVSRRHHPRWSGWRIVDRARGEPGFPGSLAKSKLLARAVEALYRREYWDVLGGDRMPADAVAAEVFDAAVHLGVTRAARLLQRGLNLLNRDTSGRRDLVVDGLIGPKTQRSLAERLRADGTPRELTTVIGLLRGGLYIDTVTVDPSQKRFIRGWLRRIGPLASNDPKGVNGK
jgi:lysozyme family protein